MATQPIHPAEHIETIDTSRFECIDGQLIERPLANSDHSNVQNSLAHFLWPLVRGTSRRGGPEFSLDQRPDRRSDWLTPDYLVSLPGGFQLNANKHALPPVYLAVEVLSPGQTFEDMQRKAKIYFAWGALYVWIIDPVAQIALTGVNGAWTRVPPEGLLETEPGFSVPLKVLLD